MGQKPKARKPRNERYFENPNKDIEQTRKKMDPQISEPTQDTFSHISTTSDLEPEKGELFDTQKSTRPSTEGKFDLVKVLKENWQNLILFPALTLIGGFVVNSNSQIGILDNKIQNIEGDIKEIGDNRKDISEIKSDVKLFDYRLKQIEKNDNSEIKK